MKLLSRQYIRSVFDLGSGEALGRVATVAIVVLIGHRFGAATLGVYALGAGLAAYVAPAIDFGLKHVGARLVARFPDSASEIVSRVQRRRALMAVVVFPLIAAYVALTRLSPSQKVFVLLFAATSALYAASLEWTAWGKGHLWVLGISRAVVPSSILFSVMIAILRGGHLLRWAAIGNVVGYVLQTVLYWHWWKRHRPVEDPHVYDRSEVREALAWRQSSVMGLAWFSNQAFVSVDVLILGLLADPMQLGFYSAAYRVLNQVLATYYLFVNALYPKLARQPATERRSMLGPSVLVPIVSAGFAAAVLLIISRRPLLVLLFGHSFVVAAPLLLILACAIPVDFLVSYLSNALVAWSMERKVLVCALTAAATNIMLNTATVPHYGALAAAVNTVISYLVYLAAVAAAARRVGAIPRR